MKTGISTACFNPYFETEAAARTIKNSGASCAEVYLRTFYEYRPEFSKALTPDISGLNVNSVRAFSPNFQAQLFSPSRRIRGDGLYWLDQIMRSAQLLGCARYTFSDDAMCAENFAEAAGGLGAILDFCAHYGVSVCVENSAYSSPNCFGELKKRYSALCGVFNLQNALRSGYPYQMYIKGTSGAVAYAHFADVDENGKICLPGKGVLNFEDILKGLHGEGFDGEVIITAPPESFGGVEDLKSSLNFLGEIIYKIN